MMGTKEELVITLCLIKQIYSNLLFRTFSYKNNIYNTFTKHAAPCLYNTGVDKINSSIKCHFQDNIYNTVIYCNNRGLKFHKKRNKTALPLPTTCIDPPKTSEMSLPNFQLLICWWGIGSVHLALLHPSGWITFPGTIYPSGCCLCQQLWQEGLS